VYISEGFKLASNSSIVYSLEGLKILELPIYVGPPNKGFSY